MINESGLIPLGHRVLLYPEVIESTSAGGIIIPKEVTHKERMAQITATVVAVGEGCWLDTTVPAWCEVGDKVLIGKFAGLLYDGEDDKEYRIVNDMDIVAKIKEKQ